MKGPFAVVALAVAIIVIVMAAPGCKTRSSDELRDREIDHALVRIDREHATLRHDTVGHDRWESTATFVLVDAYNDHDEDLMVTLGGAFLDESGQRVGRARPESLRIPAGGVRTFAMVDDQQAVRQSAVRGAFEVLGAHAPDYPSPVAITDGHVYAYDQRAVVTGMVRNTSIERQVRVIVLAGFYDADDKLMQRQFTTMYIPGDGASPARFTGPPGSVKGYIFIGDMVY